MLRVLPKLIFPVTPGQVAPLMDGVVQLNLMDGTLTEPQQRALGIYLHIFDLYVKSQGKIDYRGVAGHERLKQDAMTYSGGSPIVTRHGDLAAAHLAIDWSETAVRCRQYGLPPPPNTTSDMLTECIDLCGLSVEMEKRVGLLMDILGMKTL